jgi:lactate permease
VVPAARARFLLPKTTWDFERGEVDEEFPSNMPLALAWAPYLIVALLLVLTRLNGLPLKSLAAKRRKLPGGTFYRPG